MFFTPGQVAAWRACEQYFGAKIHVQDLQQQCCTFAVGAVAGTFCAAIPTKIFRLCSRRTSFDVSASTDVTSCPRIQRRNYLMCCVVQGRQHVGHKRRRRNQIPTAVRPCRLPSIVLCFLGHHVQGSDQSCSSRVAVRACC